MSGSKLKHDPAEISYLNAIFTSLDASTNWLLDNILGELVTSCRKCHSRTMIIKKDGIPHFIRCTNSTCKNEYVLTKDTIFYDSETPLNKILQIYLYSWINLSQVSIIYLTGCSKKVVGYFQSIPRVVAMQWLQEHPITLGGPNIRVQIDEAVVHKRKYNKGKPKEQLWVFGAIEELEGKRGRLFIILVPDRSMWTLLPIICRKILPGSIIISDEWRAYKALDIMTDYQHITVNHSKEFKNFENGACTNRIEGIWAHMRRFFPITGVRKRFLPDYLALFQVQFNREVLFVDYLKDITLYKPDPPPDPPAPVEIKEEIPQLDEQTQSIYREIFATEPPGRSRTSFPDAVPPCSSTPRPGDSDEEPDDGTEGAPPVIAEYQEDDEEVERRPRRNTRPPSYLSASYVSPEDVEAGTGESDSEFEC